jgi:hypothetical protein
VTTAEPSTVSATFVRTAVAPALSDLPRHDDVGERLVIGTKLPSAPTATRLLTKNPIPARLGGAIAVARGGCQTHTIEDYDISPPALG